MVDFYSPKEGIFVSKDRVSFEILLRPWLTGGELAYHVIPAMENLLKVADLSVGISQKKVKDVFELLILSGGIYYRMQDAFYNVFHKNLQRNIIGARRKNVNGEWISEISYESFEVYTDAPSTVLIADTVATGGTVIRGIEYMIKKGIKIEKVILISFASAYKGISRIMDWTNKNGIDFKVVVGGGLTGLADNGTDMPIIHKEAVISDELRSAALHEYGLFLASNLCSIWDWGERNKAPLTHYQTVLKKLNELEPEMDEYAKSRAGYIREMIMKRIREMEEQIGR